MRVCALSRIVAVAFAVSFLVATASQSMAQGMSPVPANYGCDVTAVNPGNYSYQEPCGYPMGNSFAECCDPCRCGPRWTFAAEAVALQRSSTRNQALFLQPNTTTTLLNSNDFRFPVAYGPKLSGIRHNVFGSNFDIEVGYFQFDGFEANRTVPGTSWMVTSVNQAFLGSTNSTARYASQLYCGEVNVRWQWFDRITFLSGFRMVELNEQYDARGTNGADQLSVDANTFNHLYGYQLGAEGEVLDLGCLQITALCKAGAFGNFASQNIQAVNTNQRDPFNESLSATNRRVSFLGEVGLAATYSITERLAFRASLQAMWLEGVGLAPEQIDTSNFTVASAKVDLDGGVFYYGGGMGLEYRF